MLKDLFFTWCEDLYLGRVENVHLFLGRYPLVSIVAPCKRAIHFLKIVGVVIKWFHRCRMNLVGLADCKGVAVGALGHPRVELELLLQVFASFLQIPHLSQHFNRLAGQYPALVLL